MTFHTALHIATLLLLAAIELQTMTHNRLLAVLTRPFRPTNKSTPIPRP